MDKNVSMAAVTQLIAQQGKPETILNILAQILWPQPLSSRSYSECSQNLMPKEVLRSKKLCGNLNDSVILIPVAYEKSWWQAVRR